MALASKDRDQLFTVVTSLRRKQWLRIIPHQLAGRITVDILRQQKPHGSRLHHLDITSRFNTTREFPSQQVPKVSNPPTRLFLRLCPPVLYTSRLPVLWYRPRALKSTICRCQQIHVVLPDTLEPVATRQSRRLRPHGCPLRRDTRYLNVYLHTDERHSHIRHINPEGR